MPIATWLVILLVVLIIGWFVAVYNRLVSLRNQVAEAWSDIDVQLKRRYDLIPNIVNSVKAYARHEKSVFEQVTKLRTAALQANSPKEKAQADSLMTTALKSLFAVSENYPQLRAAENFKQLQEELADTEDKIAASRRFYNSVTRDYNTAIESFPTNVFAQWLKFSVKELFEAQGQERAAVAVKL